MHITETPTFSSYSGELHLRQLCSVQPVPLYLAALVQRLQQYLSLNSCLTTSHTPSLSETQPRSF